jgi:Ni/Fe-hydrogenase subunit HybB-like protein
MQRTEWHSSHVIPLLICAAAVAAGLGLLPLPSGLPRFLGGATGWLALAALAAASLSLSLLYCCVLLMSTGTSTGLKNLFCFSDFDRVLCRSATCRLEELAPP